MQRRPSAQPGNLINGFLGTFPTAAERRLQSELRALRRSISSTRRGNTYNEGYFQLLRRNVEGGPRHQRPQAHHLSAAWSARAATCSNAFSYDAYYQYGKTNYSQVYKNEFSVSRLNKALNVVNVDANGRRSFRSARRARSADCRSVLDSSDPNCVPYDIFWAARRPAAVNYLNVFGVISGQTSEQIANVNFTGAARRTWASRRPWADDGVGINVGYEYRKELLEP